AVERDVETTGLQVLREAQRVGVDARLGAGEVLQVVDPEVALDGADGLAEQLIDGGVALLRVDAELVEVERGAQGDDVGASLRAVEATERNVDAGLLDRR